MCTSKILDIAAFWNEEKHKAVELDIDIFFFPMKGELRRCGQQKETLGSVRTSNQRA